MTYHERLILALMAFVGALAAVLAFMGLVAP